MCGCARSVAFPVFRPVAADHPKPLPPYSGGTAPEFNRLPSRPCPLKRSENKAAPQRRFQLYRGRPTLGQAFPGEPKLREMPRLVNENFPRASARARPRLRYLLISLGIHAALFFALVWLRSGARLSAEAPNASHVAIEFSAAPTSQGAETQPELPAQEAPAPTEPSATTSKPAPAPVTRDAGERSEVAAPTLGSNNGKTAPRSSPAQILPGSGEDRGGIQHPPYPRWARERGWEGHILLELEVLSTGRVGTVTVVESTGHPQLDHYTAAWARENLRFEPATLGGVPVATSYRWSITFALRERG